MAPKSIVAIDGPAGAGKSTVAQLTAKGLGFFYIDTGAMYRALALKVKRLSISSGNIAAVISLLDTTTIQLRYEKGRLQVFLDGEDVSQEIRKPYITETVSDIAKIKQVRDKMTHLQRALASKNDCVLEGRDIGTVVFPNAQFKFFIDADFEERAKRRYKELTGRNPSLTLEAVRKDLASRDHIDSTRECAPLKRADDAFYIDTTRLSIQQVVEIILSQIRSSLETSVPQP